MAGVTQATGVHPEGDVLTHVARGARPRATRRRGTRLECGAARHGQTADLAPGRGPDPVRWPQPAVATMAAVLRRLHAASDELRELVVDVCRDHMPPPLRQPAADAAAAAGGLDAVAPHFAAHLAFHRADCLGSHGKLDVHALAAAASRGIAAGGPPLVTGADVLALGVPAGPAVGELLRAVHEAADEAPTAMAHADPR